MKNLAPVLLDEPLSTAAPSLSSCRPARRELTSKTPEAKPIFQKRWAIFSAKPKVGVFVWLQAVNIWKFCLCESLLNALISNNVSGVAADFVKAGHRCVHLQQIIYLKNSWIHPVMITSIFGVTLSFFCFVLFS